MHPELDETALAAPGEFARYVAALVADVETPGEPDRYVSATVRRGGARAEGGRLRAADDPLVGRGRRVSGSREHPAPPDRELARRADTSATRCGRARGGAGTRRRCSPPRCRVPHALGIDLALVDCDAANVASRRVIEKNGGRLEREEDGNLYFLVPTRPGT